MLDISNYIEDWVYKPTNMIGGLTLSQPGSTWISDVLWVLWVSFIGMEGIWMACCYEWAILFTAPKSSRCSVIIHSGPTIVASTYLFPNACWGGAMHWSSHLFTASSKTCSMAHPSILESFLPEHCQLWPVLAFFYLQLLGGNESRPRTFIMTHYTLR